MTTDDPVGMPMPMGWHGLRTTLLWGSLLGCNYPATNAEQVSQKADGRLVTTSDDSEATLATDSQTTDLGTDSLHDEGAARPAGTPPLADLAHPSFLPPAAGQMVKVPAGTLLLGSPVDDPLRVQFAEADQQRVDIQPFEMDALPYPNDPAATPVTGVSFQQAHALCQRQGKRLCTEVEWEWACESSDSRRYPSSNRYDQADYAAADPTLPASPFGVFALGRLEEWTASGWGDNDPEQGEKNAVRGYSAGLGVSEAVGRRCAHRTGRLPSEVHPNLGLRCCRGQASEFQQEIERPRPPFSVYNNIKPEKFEQILRSIPELSAVHDLPHMFSDADIRTVMARRGTDLEGLSKSGIRFIWKPLRWIPRQGMELWVGVGRSLKHSFVVALHESVDNEAYVHASSLILWNQPVPLALGYREGHRDELYWAPCWGCRDGGTIAFDDATGQVVITHKW